MLCQTARICILNHRERHQSLSDSQNSSADGLLFLLTLSGAFPPAPHPLKRSPPPQTQVDCLKSIRHVFGSLFIISECIVFLWETLVPPPREWKQALKSYNFDSNTLFVTCCLICWDLREPGWMAVFAASTIFSLQCFLALQFHGLPFGFSFHPYN